MQTISLNIEFIVVFKNTKSVCISGIIFLLYKMWNDVKKNLCTPECAKGALEERET